MNWFVSFLLVILRPALGLIILAGLLIYWILKKKLPKEKFLKLIVYIFSGVIIFQSIFSTILNWWLWSQQGLTQRFLPPHSPISYVLRYSWQHYWFESIITIITAIIVFFGIYFLNKKFEKNLFYDEEKYLAALGILAVGWPDCLIFLCLVLFLGVVLHLISFLFNKGRSRLPLLYFWIPCALLVLLLSDIISKYIGVVQLTI
ncbi:hypothetical protein D4R42_00410 [bacterium]|nr:MAG: hypothetical protein D4R42_00410 [bacterium]